MVPVTSTRVTPSGRARRSSPGSSTTLGINDYFGFLCDAEPTVFANPAGTCGALAGAGFQTKAINLNLPSIGVSQVAGSETITRTVTSVSHVSQHYKVSVDAPAGYEVAVSPDEFKLRAGESQTYKVTFTNVSAPIGAWAFGSLTWKSGGGYEARSPIALRASKFSAPLSITGTGVTGTASFDVKFGYTGAYAAVPAGLVKATETDANVKHDEDQTFQLTDVGTGATVHEFALTNAGVLRVAIPPDAVEPDADLDVYVYNPSGVQVASSTLGGTDEEVTIQSPANGTWKVYVHGWQAPGGDSDYTLYSWVVPMSGGTMTATGPSSATLGATGTINLSWTGATGWNLGAVSHMEGSTVLGRTLVEVDNR